MYSDDEVGEGVYVRSHVKLPKSTQCTGVKLAELIVVETDPKHISTDLFCSTKHSEVAHKDWKGTVLYADDVPSDVPSCSTKHGASG